MAAAAAAYGGHQAENGSVHTNGKLNGQTSTTKPRSRKPQRGFFAWALSFIARIATWAAILTILLRCPDSLEACNEQSPIICKPYFRVKHAVTPHVQPYYDQYAAPYIRVATPYYNTLNEHVLTPSRHVAVQYGKPLIKKGQDTARSQWIANGQPQLLRIQKLANAQYDQLVSPQLARATKVVGPYYRVVHKHSVHVYDIYLLPAYELTRPFAVRGYNTASDFATTTALPAGYWAWTKTNAFLDTAVWPQLRVVYVANVEPQLVRIGERLARYRTKAKASKPSSAGSITFSSIPTSTPSSISESIAQTSSTAPTLVATQEPETSVPAPQKTVSQEYWNPVQAPPASEDEDDVRKAAREMVANDLATWQNKFASQAEEGAGALESQIEEIARAIMDGETHAAGKTLLKELEDTIASEVLDLKSKIQSIVKVGGAEAEGQVIAAIRSTGSIIKKAAQTVRGWREDYDAELQEAVFDAAEVHFQILEETRGLALQNIGMKWAWSNGVTYQDWQKYHDLKNTLNNWTEDLKKLIVSHPALIDAQEFSHQVEEDAMTMAGIAAQELARLKEASAWKIRASDASDNFDTEEMRLAAEAAQQATKDAAEASSGDSQVSGSTQDINAEEQGSETSTVIVADKSDGDEALDEEPVIEIEPVEPGSFTEPEQSPNMLDDEVGMDDVSIDLDADDSSRQSTITTTKEEAGTALSGTQGGPVTPVMFGAAAQFVADRSPILDTDDSEDANYIASLTNAAQAAYSTAVALAADQYSSAASVVSAQVQGTSKPVHEQLFSSVSSAYDGAVSAASQKLNEAVAAASDGVYKAAPSPTKSSNIPDWKKVEAIAAQRLNEGRLSAEVQYQSVLIAIGAATATPTSTPEKIYEEAKYHYFAGLGMAQDRYSSFISAASSAWSSVTAVPTPTPTDLAGSASSLASVAGKSAASAASVADEAVKSVYNAASDGVKSAAQDAQDTLENLADSAAEQVVNAAGFAVDAWDVVVARISADVYGQPSAIGWYDGATKTAGSAVSAATEAVADSASSASDAAAKQLAALNQIISELIVGKEPTFSESVMSRLSGVYATATSHVGSLASEASSVVASVGDKVGSAASQATEAVKETAQKVRDEL